MSVRSRSGRRGCAATSTAAASTSAGNAIGSFSSAWISARPWSIGGRGGWTRKRRVGLTCAPSGFLRSPSVPASRNGRAWICVCPVRTSMGDWQCAGTGDRNEARFRLRRESPDTYRSNGEARWKPERRSAPHGNRVAGKRAALRDGRRARDPHAGPAALPASTPLRRAPERLPRGASFAAPNRFSTSFPRRQESNLK